MQKDISMSIRFQDIKRGQLFYEGAYGMNMELVAMSDAEVINIFGADEGTLSGKKQFGFKAKDTQTGKTLDYVQTEGMSHYGPSLYSFPAYVQTVKNKGEVDLIFPLANGEKLDLDDPVQKELRSPENLLRWISSGSETPLSDWSIDSDDLERFSP